MPVIGKHKLHKNQVHKLDIQKHRLLFLFLNLFYDSVHKLCGANIGILFGLLSSRTMDAQRGNSFYCTPKIPSRYQIFRYSRSIFCLPHRSKLSDIFNFDLHRVSVVRGLVLVQRWWKVQKSGGEQ